MGHALGNNYGKFYSFLSKPVLLDLNFIVDSTNGNGLGIRSLKGQGVNKVYMHTSATPAAGNPNPAAGYCLIELEYNYNRIYAGPLNIISPLSGSNLAINASALTPGNPYVIVSVGHGAAGSETITTVADVSGSLAGKYFKLFDNYGNVFIVWFQVSGVGVVPANVSGSLYKVQISTNDSANSIAATLNTLLPTLPSGISGVFSFTSSVSTNQVTLTSTQFQPLSGVAQDASSPLQTGFSFALVNSNSNLGNWQAVGVPKGVVPAVGVSFIAIAAGQSSGGGSTGLVQAPSVSGIFQQEVIGDPNLSMAPIPMGGSPNVGGMVLLQFLNASDAVTNPANGSVISMTLYLEQATRVGGNQE